MWDHIGGEGAKPAGRVVEVDPGVADLAGRALGREQLPDRIEDRCLIDQLGHGRGVEDPHRQTGLRPTKKSAKGSSAEVMPALRAPSAAVRIWDSEIFITGCRIGPPL